MPLPTEASNLGKTLAKINELLSAVRNPILDDWDPLELGLLISKLEYEDLDVEVQKTAFLRAVEPLIEDFDRSRSLWDQAEHLIKIYNEGLGFKGDTTNYYNFKNSFMSDVLVRRKGIPISLSLVFLGLCRRVGLRAVGISFPGHFLVRLVTPEEREGSVDWKQHRYIDPFENGRILTVKDCEARLEQWTRGVLRFGPDSLKVAHPQEIASRTLRNLRAIFQEKEDLPRLYWVLSALIEVCPTERTESYKERGLLLGRMGRYNAAAVDLKTYLTICPDLQKAAHAERLLRLFEGQREFTN
jgi:regulator of sirC expression with transglutaminase-like and TPR domain